MGWRIEDYPSQLFITDSVGNSKFYLKATLSCYASLGNIVIADSVLGIILNQNPSNISLPVINGVCVVVMLVTSVSIIDAPAVPLVPGIPAGERE